MLISENKKVTMVVIGVIVVAINVAIGYSQTNEGVSNLFGIDNLADIYPISDMNEDIRNELNLPIGVKGVLLISDFYGLKAPILIESIFHRYIQDKSKFIDLWVKHQPSGQILLGYYELNNGQWERAYKFTKVSHSQSEEKSSTQTLLINIDEIEEVSKQKIIYYRKWQEAWKNELRDITSRANEWSPEKTTRSIVEAKERLYNSFDIERIKSAKDTLLDYYTTSYPIAHKIVIKTITKTTENSNELVLDLAKGVLTGGNLLGTTVGMNALESSMEVLEEEGLISYEQFQIISSTISVINSLQGIQGTDDAIRIIEASSKALHGVTELSQLSDYEDTQTIITQLKTGSEKVNLVIKCFNPLQEQ